MTKAALQQLLVALGREVVFLDSSHSAREERTLCNFFNSTGTDGYDLEERLALTTILLSNLNKQFFKLRLEL